MALFENLQLHGVPKKGTVTHWIFKIDNEKDLFKFHELDAEANMRSFMSMRRREDELAFDHLGAVPSRDIALNTLIKLSIDALPEGEKLYPILEVAKITDQKYLSMLRHIRRTGAIQINPNGGFCDYNAYIETWDAIVISSIVKDDFGFPIEDAAINANTIVLENSYDDRVGNNGEYFAKTLGIKDAGACATIFNLKEVDRAYVYQCLKNAKNIIIPTEAQDKEQVNGFMKLFLKLPKKDIYVRCSSETKKQITDHELFAENSLIHNIKFSSWRNS